MSTPRSIVLLGATGFVGSHLVPRLAAAGHRLTLLSRHGERHHRLVAPPNVKVVTADVHDHATLAGHLRDADVAVNLVGILNEHGRQTFAHVHVELTRSLIAACRETGVGRLLQMSSLKAGQGTSGYLRSRGEAEALVKASGLDWTLFQPSVIFGRGDGLVSRFHALLKMAPLMPLARPGARMAPVFVGDVARAIARSVDDVPASIGQTYQLYGPETLRLEQIVGMIRDAARLHRPIIGLPDALGYLQALALGLLPGKPFSLDNYRSLLVDSVGDSDGLAALGIERQSFSAMLPALVDDLTRKTHPGAPNRKDG